MRQRRRRHDSGAARVLLLLLLLALSARGEQLAAHWDETYAARDGVEGPVFEFGGGWAKLGRVVLPYVKGIQSGPGPTILQLGCGNSRMAAAMIADGVAADALLSTDFSPVVIESNRKRHPDLQFAVADVMDLQFADGSFEVVVEKGVLELFQDYGEPVASARMLSEVWRVLAPGGVFLTVSAAPQSKLDAVASAQRQDWRVEKIVGVGGKGGLGLGQDLDTIGAKVTVMRKARAGGSPSAATAAAATAAAAQDHVHSELGEKVELGAGAGVGAGSGAAYVGGGAAARAAAESASAAPPAAGSGARPERGSEL